MNETLYFAYGSNMNLDQMSYRCPHAQVVGAVRLEDYRLAFRGGGISAVATILPQEGEHVDGVLWRITTGCEQSLDRYEGYPRLYGKQMVTVTDANGTRFSTMVYTMNLPYKELCGIPSRTYVDGILEGARQNGVSVPPIRKAIQNAAQECIRGCTVQQPEASRKKSQTYER